MPLPDKATMQSMKAQALKDAQDVFNRFEANPMTKGKYKWEDIENRINDSKRFEQFARLKSLSDKRREQQKVKRAICDKYPELDPGNGTALSRCIDLYMKTEDSKEAMDYNMSILKKYSTAEGRIEMATEAMKNVKQITFNTFTANTSSAENMISYLENNRLLVEQGFLANNLLGNLAEANVPEEFEKLYCSTQGMYENMNTFLSFEGAMGSPLNFFVENPDKMPTMDEVIVMQMALPPSAANPYRDQMQSLQTHAFCAEEIGKINKVQSRASDEVDFSKPLDELKAVDQNGKEVDWMYAFEKLGTDFEIVQRDEKEIKNLNFDSLTVKPKHVEILNNNVNKIIDSFKKDTNEKINSLVDLSATHNSKKAPGFFSRLFNTKYNKTYNKEIQDIAAKKSELEQLGIDKDTIDQLSTVKTDEDKKKAPTNAALNSAVNERFKESVVNFKAANTSQKEQLTVEEANNASTKQKVVGAKQRVNVMEKTKEMDTAQRS